MDADAPQNEVEHAVRLVRAALLGRSGPLPGTPASLVDYAGGRRSFAWTMAHRVEPGPLAPDYPSEPPSGRRPLGLSGEKLRWYHSSHRWAERQTTTTARQRRGAGSFLGQLKRFLRAKFARSITVALRDAKVKKKSPGIGEPIGADNYRIRDLPAQTISAEEIGEILDLLAEGKDDEAADAFFEAFGEAYGFDGLESCVADVGSIEIEH
jgi:hypothetical protein